MFLIHRPEQQINLVLVRKQLKKQGNMNDIQDQATSVKMNEIGSLNGGKTAAHFVLIEGKPKIGKSTLCWQLCRLWSKGEMLYQWDLMVIVQLRDEKIRKAENLEDLLHYPDETRQSFAKHIMKRDGEGLFLLLDGYDELKQQLSEVSIMQKILTNRLIRKATVVVTSRPGSIATLPAEFKAGLKQVEYQHIEISDFDKHSDESHAKDTDWHHLPM